MPRIKKIQENETTVYPVTIPEAIVLPDTQEKLSDILFRIVSAINNKVDSTDIVDNLDTEDATSPLSAKQGRVLAAIKQDSLASGDGISIVNDVISVRFNKSDDDIAGPDSNGAYTLKNRTYNSLNPNGLGYVILKKKFSFASQVRQENTIYEIRHDFSLGGETVTIPAGCVLLFNGGSISSGTLVGNSTKIIAISTGIFSSIIISGSWVCPHIFSDWFVDIHDNNVIRQLINLSADTIKNIITVCPGTFQVSVTEEDESVLCVKSNTDFMLAGEIVLSANSYGKYKIIDINQKENVRISGGIITGDKDTHTGSSGEWGFGVSITDSKNIVIDSIKVQECWGDCIYLGGTGDGCQGIIIKDFYLSEGRRQGISIVNGTNIDIINGVIDSISGTDPQSCIDIEPNSTFKCSNITISDCVLSNSVRGFDSYRANANAEISNIYLINIKEVNCNRVNLRYIKNLNVRNSLFTTPQIVCSDCENVVFDTFSMQETHLNIIRPTRIVLRNGSIISSESLNFNTVPVISENVDYQMLNDKNLTLKNATNCTVSTGGLVLLRSNIHNLTINYSIKQGSSAPCSLQGASVKGLRINLIAPTDYKSLYALFSYATGNNVIEDIVINDDAGVSLTYLCNDGTNTTLRNVKFTGDLVTPKYSVNANADKCMTVFDFMNEKGTTANRPALDSSMNGALGFCYYDTTLNQPIWWKGTGWVDATGTTA